MLRPATPLTILYFIAFALLLLSTLSTPIIKSIPLGRYTAAGGQQFDFGVFGWCGPTGNCTSIALGYTTGLTGEFTLPDTTRHTLSAVLVVHPIAAFFTLICTILSASAHLHTPGRSPKFLLWLLILSFPTLLISLLAFLVDILLFIPGVQWGGWIVLAATILITVCSILTCAMRRTLVSRTARQKRIDNNADMNGETYYQTRQEQQLNKSNTMPIMMTTSEPANQFDRAESPPPLDNSSGMANGKPPHSAAYGSRNRPRLSTDDRIPLNPQNPRAASVRTTSTGRGANGNGRVSPVSPIGYEDSPPSGMRREPSDPRYRGPPPNGRGGPPQAYGRGRGGYHPPRGGYPPMRGGPPPRGRLPPPRGYPPRGGYARGGPPGIRPPPPPQQGWYQDGSAMGPMAGGAAAGMAGAAIMGRGQRGPPPGYQNGYYGQPEVHDPYGGDASYDGGMYGGPAPRDPRNHGYNQNSYYNSSAAPDQDLRYDEPQSAVSRRSFERRPSEAARDPSSFGFSGRQPSPGLGQNGSGVDRSVSPLPPIPPVDPNRIPPGQAIEMDATSGSPQTPIGFAQTTFHNEPIEMGDRSPPQQHATPRGAIAELPSPNPNEIYTRQTANRPRKTSEPYYEDVDGRFAQVEDDERPMQPARDQSHPSTLLPGGYGKAVSLSQLPPQGPPPPEALEHQPSASSFYGDAPEHPQQYDQRPRSPAHSETSHFTSVSQRGVNPGWQQAEYGQYGEEIYPTSTRGPPQSQKRREQDQALTNNPDFAVPGGQPMNRVRENRGHSKGGSASGSQGGIYSGGRYPGAV